MISPKTLSRFNHWLNKKSFTAVLLCLFAVCCLAFSATTANCQSVAYPVTSKTLTKGQAVNIAPTSSGINPYGYDAVSYPNSTNFKTGFDYPNDIAIDKEGLNLYVADRYGKRIVVVPAAYSGNIEGHITKVYNLDANPFAIAVDQQNNIYYSDSVDNNIKKCLPSGGCSVYAAGAVTFAFSIAVDKAGNLYVVDSQQLKVKKIPAGGGAPVDFGGTWSAPNRVRVDSKDNVYVTDGTLKVIRKIPADGSAPVNIDIGESYPTNAQYGLTIDNSGNLFTSRFTPSPAQVRETFADGSGTVVIPFVPCCDVRSYGDQGNRPNLPKGIVVDALGRLHMADGIPNKRVQTVSPVGGYFVHPALPDGLSLDRNTGVISGTPTMLNAATTYTITGWNASEYTSTSITLNVISPAPNVSSITPSTGPVGTVVILSGSNLKGVKQFSIGGKPGILISNDGTSILGLVAGGTASGAVAITNVDNAIVTSSANFNVTASPAIPLTTRSTKFGATVTTGNTDVNQGYSVAISANGTTAVLGAPNYANGKGALIIFTRNNAGAWIQQGPVLANPYSNPALGVSVAISADGNTVIGGGRKMQNATTGFLSMRTATVLFTRSGTSWTAAGDFGLSDAVALSGDGKFAVLGTVEPNSDSHLAPNAILTIFAKDSVGNSYTAPPPFYQGVANFISLAFSGSRTLVVGKPGAFTTSGRGGSTYYGSTGVIYNIGERGYPEGGGTNLKSSVYQGQGYEGSLVAISGDGKVVISGGPATNPVTFRRLNDSTWTQTPGVMLGAAGGQVSLNVDGTVALVALPNKAVFYKWNGTDWGTPLTALPITAGLSAAALTPDATNALLGFAFDATGSGAAQVITPAPPVPPAPPANAPTLSATKLTFSATSFDRTTVGWTNGNGTKRAVFIAKTNNGVASPASNTTYAADASFGDGTQIGTTGWYCIYNGDGNSVNITGLASNATYRVTVVEYNGEPTGEKYLLTKLAPASLLTALSPNDPPAVPSLQLTFSNTAATTTNVSWTSGSGAMRAVFVAKTANGVAAPVNDNVYTANATFGTGSQINGTGWYCVYNGTGNTAAISGLDPSSTYRVTVVDYNNTGAPKYMSTKLAPASVLTLTSPSVAPTTPSLKLTFANITPTGTTVNWISGSGGRRAVFIARRADGVAAPVNNSTYSPNANFATGTQIGTTGWYCVYDGTGSSANISGLTAGTTYRVTVIDYNGAAGAQKYMDTKLAPAILTTTATSPTIPSLKLTFTNTTATTTNVSWISGNGAMRAVFVAKTANGVANAVNNTTYTGPQNFEGGTQIGSTGWYCVYNGNGNNTNITGLLANTTYRVTVIEYNGGTGAQLYTNNKLNPASVTTLPLGTIAPTAPSLSLTFSNTTSTATTVNWTSGNGFRRAVFVARRSDGVAAPTDNTAYMGNPTFAAGAQIGATGWYCVYNGIGNSADITGLTPGTVYRVTVVDFNGSVNGEKYMSSKLAPGSVLTATGSGLRLGFTSLKSDVPGDEMGVSAIEASNLLSPNGDGKNDTWMVKNIEQYSNNSVTVYDQGSNVIFTKKGYANDWAGTYRGGVVKEGTYYYLIDLGNGTTKKGFITVLSSRQ